MMENEKNTELKFMLKPDWVSWESVKDCLVSAHEYNRKRGFNMYHSTLSAQKLADYLKDGYCFVALNGDKVVATCSLKVLTSQNWWAKGKRIAYTCLDGTAAKYKGTEAYFGLRELRNNHIKELGLRIMQFDTHEENLLVQKLNLKRKFKYVRYCAFPMTDYYSVVMVKWLDGCPYSERYINFRYRLSKYLTRLFFKPGRKLRFRFW